MTEKVEMISEQFTENIEDTKVDKEETVPKKSENTEQNILQNEVETKILNDNNSSSSEKNTNESTHTHSYSNATCTTAKQCSCGATAGDPLGHNYVSATCTLPKTCIRCGVTTGSELGHKWQTATCKAPKTCKICKTADGTVVEHKYDNFICCYCGCKDEYGIAIATNPKLSFKGGKFKTQCSKEYVSGDYIRVSTINFGSPMYVSCIVYSSNSDDFSKCYQNNFVIYNDKKYYDYAGSGGPCETWYYELTDEYITLYSNSKQLLKCTLNMDGTLTVVESDLKSGHSCFIEGTILQ